MSEPFRVGISHDFAKDAKGRYEAAVDSVLGQDPHIRVEMMPEALDDWPSRADLDSYDAILALNTRVGSSNLDGLERLALIARWGVGYDRIDTAALSEAGALLAITPNAVRRPVAEAAIALIFASTLNLVRQHQIVEQGQWRGALPRLGRNMSGRILGSIGLGNIAKEMFRMSESLGFGGFLAHDPYANAEDAKRLNVKLVSLDELFRESDFLCVHCFLNESTRGIVRREYLQLMKPTAHVINTARGPIVREADLAEALEKGWIAGAALDVFEIEPLPPDAPIRKAPNLILAPHGLAWTEEIARDNSLEAARNILALSRGELPGAIVNREALDNPKFQAKLEKFRR
jgi:phosphoglycerate dehydrogenase-like enzyme